MNKILSESELLKLIARLEQNLKVARSCRLGVVISQQDTALVIALLKKETKDGA